MPSMAVLRVVDIVSYPKNITDNVYMAHVVNHRLTILGPLNFPLGLQQVPDPPARTFSVFEIWLNMSLNV